MELWSPRPKENPSEFKRVKPWLPGPSLDLALIGYFKIVFLRDWRDGAASRALASHTYGPEFNPQIVD